MDYKKGLSLLELLIIISVLGVLASVAIVQYRNMFERARLQEALVIMDQIRKAEWLYYQKHDAFSENPENLTIEPSLLGSFDLKCSNVSWFSFDIEAEASGDFSILARRCTGEGKSPTLPESRGYGVRMYSNGTVVCDYSCDNCPVRLP
ncbi:MAG: prepilin-type N-terminal cleavage/methylation domain-containing protein [Candidatus Omnitrophica bacterium]|nr:prepilin-type N-terminal cleavage/methylation domain-containing protein [Candidatus Omnitrophota bacterium]